MAPAVITIELILCRGLEVADEEIEITVVVLVRPDPRIRVRSIGHDGIARDDGLEVGPLTCQVSEPLSMNSMTMAPDGRMYALGDSYLDPSGNDCYYRVDISTAQLEFLGAPEGFIWAIEFGPDGTLYGPEYDLMVLDPADGTILETRGELSPAFIVELDFSADGDLCGTDDDTGLYRIATATGAATLLTDYSEGDPIRSLASGSPP